MAALRQKNVQPIILIIYVKDKSSADSNKLIKTNI